MTETNMPGFAAEASLYKTRGLYRGYGAMTGPDTSSTVAPADANYDCTNSCLGWAEAGAVVCMLAAGLFTPAAGATCLMGDALTALKCIIACPPPGNGGGGNGGGGGPAPCCGYFRTCRCGGKCVNVNGQLRCVDGFCLGPNERCP